jgi:maltodextrin utilization protein YvdJ
MANFYAFLAFLIGAVYAIFFLYLYKSKYFISSAYGPYPKLYANGKLTKWGKLANSAIFLATLILIGLIVLLQSASSYSLRSNAVAGST